MSGRSDEAGDDAVAKQAARWFVRLHDDDSTREDWLAFEVWLAEAPEHHGAYERVEEAWVDAEAAGPALMIGAARPGGSAATPDLQPRSVGSSVQRPGQRRGAGRPPAASRRAWIAGAAALAASLAVAVVAVDQWPGAAPGETFITPQGQTRKVTLADGSHVWLNAGTRIDVRLERKARRIQLADGEAVFDVAHDAARPFLISTGQREVRVVGTEFNLRQRDGDFDLVVRRGVVEVRPAGDPIARPTRVAAGHRLAAPRGTPGVLSATAPDAAFAWTQGQLIYENAALSTVAADLTRSLGAPVRVADAATGQVRFSGVLALDDKAAVLRRLEGFAPVRIEASGDGYLIRRR